MRTLWSVFFSAYVLLCSRIVQAQTIQDIWETTSDQKSLFKQLPTSASVDFNTADGGDAEIDVDDGTVYQTVYGFGATLTDSSASVLNNLKNSNGDAYTALLKSVFDNTGNSAGLNYIRVPLGATDFSPNVYSYDDKKNDTSLSSFSVDVTPDYVFPVLQDIQAICKNMKIHLVPWSPPAWMKDSGTMDGGNFLAVHSGHMANYLLKSAQSFKSKGFSPYALSIQNEVENSNPSLPSAVYTTKIEAAVAVKLRKLLDANGMNDVKIIGYEHNWADVTSYAVQLMREDGAADAFAGVAFHCYEGNVGQQDDFHNAFPDKEIYSTECTGVVGSEWWSDIQFYTNNIVVGAATHWAQAGLMWNFAVDPQGNPKLPGATSCGEGCRGIVQVSSDGTTQLNQEYYAMAHASKAVLPLNEGGAFGQRIGVDVSGSQESSLTVGAYVTAANGTSSRYSLVVMNSDSGTLKTAIKFRGNTAIYSFPTGLTTMSWFTTAASSN
ncbi:glycoside hydrolase superfamily [Phellopilus nigrolimitatus]|nr:glycoside hydrolase superfamily [Phellopilus nigrolimitatus]